ncbi:MAG: flavodoxin family protein [Blastococcus sp.]
MARALVVYESLFGDARAIAQAVADGISKYFPVDVVGASDAPAALDPDVRLLVVGGPNHRSRMPTRASRQEAMDTSGVEIDVPATGLHEWLDTVRLADGDVAAAAFDTRLEHPWVLTHMDHAARAEERLLRRDGAILIAPAEHFHVTTGAGPLVEGEEERARRWGESLAVRAGTRAVGMSNR